MAESPAEAAGLQRGDEVLEVEGIPATQLTMDETTTLLRGPAGSSVELVVQQRGSTRHLMLERQRLPQPPLKEARLPLPDGRRIAYLRLHYFSGEGTAALKRAVVSGEEDGVAGYVLDLRNNPGEGVQGGAGGRGG
jgi:carboxyl-terminal processing protease